MKASMPPGSCSGICSVSRNSLSGSYSTTSVEVETRNLRGPHTYDNTGIPLHKDDQTVIKERFHLDKANPDLLVDEIATIDHALTRPWGTVKRYRLEREKVLWSENSCTLGNDHVAVGTEDYMISADGYLMPVRKDQAPPDVRYFTRARKRCSPARAHGSSCARSWRRSRPWLKQAPIRACPRVVIGALPGEHDPWVGPQQETTTSRAVPFLNHSGGVAGFHCDRHAPGNLSRASPLNAHLNILNAEDSR
jgi:hypothetical protein